MNLNWDVVGLLAGIIMPVFNIPLMVRIIRRKTSEDISLSWAFGVWICILLMLPSALKCDELKLKGYAISNALFFTAVVAVVLMYRKNGKKEKIESPKEPS